MKTVRVRAKDYDETIEWVNEARAQLGVKGKKVTKLRSGKAGDPWHCPIANTIEAPDGVGVSISHGLFKYDYSGTHRELKVISSAVERVIEAVDGNGESSTTVRVVRGLR